MMEDQNPQYENDRGAADATERPDDISTTDSNDSAAKAAEQNWEADAHTARGQMPQRRAGVPVWVLVMSIALSALLSFGATLGALGVAHVLLPGDELPADDGTDTLDPQSGETETLPDVHASNPESILDKSEPNQSIYGSAGEDVFSVSTVARRVEDAVVVINAKIIGDFGQNTLKSSAGSGVVISEDGYILTCNHVVEGAREVSVVLNSGKTYNAMLVGSDAASDLAVLKITPEEGEIFLHVEQGCSEDLVNGERVVAIGNPLGVLGGTVTEGIVSATEREITMSDGTKMTLIQTDAAINSGNSGGGLFNLDGQLIGVVNAKYSDSGVEGLAFAIPIDSAYTVQLDLIQYGYVRGVVDHGLEILEVTEDMLRHPYYMSFGLTEAGVYIVNSDYSEELENADLIRTLNGRAIATTDDFEAVLAECKVGDVLTVTVSRRTGAWLSGKTEEVTVELELREFVPDRLKDRLN